jgi:hypothetical protein
MATRKRNTVESALTQKGFELQADGDHRYYFFFFNGRRIARTKVSRGTKYKDLADDLLQQMARQCCLTKGHFLNLIDCSMTQEQYEAELKQQGYLE